MKISIITICFNSETTIAACLESVAGQTYANIEHIVIDGASPDKTLEIVKSFPSVSKCISEPDTGIYDALNKGIQVATGEVIGFLHSNDLLASPNTIAEIANLFNTRQNINGVYGDLVYFSTPDLNKVVRNWRSKTYRQNDIKYGWMPPHPTLFLKKEVYQKYGLFDISYKIAGDYDFMLRVMRDKEIYIIYLPEVITKMKMGGVSTGNLHQLIAKSKEDIRALRNNRIAWPYFVLLAKNIRKLPQLFKR